MKNLWEKKDTPVTYHAKKRSIAMIFGISGRKDVIDYVRNYTILSESELVSLLNDAKENNWTSLDLSNCGIHELPEQLWEISSLRVLYLGNYMMDGETANTFHEISENIGKLSNLEALSICNVTKLKIPEALKTLPHLTYLDCFGCDFTRISNNLLNKNIKSIGIDCATEKQVQQICKIKRLEEIFLTGSNISELPIEIGNLKYLRTLYLVNTKIKTIPQSLLTLTRLSRFEIHNTPLQKEIPLEMRNQKASDLIAYICKQQNQTDTYTFNESKMIVVGQGNVGKSCLVDRITNDTYEEKESTEGIDVKKWEYIKNKKKYSLNIWDFGGQEIYHSTHQFFLTKRSLYIFVWDARAEEEYGRIDYWLKTIESFADDSPIIIVINKCDEKTTRVNRIDLKEYKEKYPQIKNILDISCKDNINISRLKYLVKIHASNLPITKEKWLKTWFDIRMEIESLSNIKKYITNLEYISICRKHGVESEEAKSLSKYLHDLGVILHYQDDFFLKDIVILSPEWATSAVYKILDSQESILRNRNGVLYLSDLSEIWCDTELYPEDKYVFLLKIMEKFQLCFELDKDSYLVAELLENTAINIPKNWDLRGHECISIVYKYDFMPAGVMTRFIVKVHEYIASEYGKSLCWRKGVYLKHKTAYASVIMKDSLAEKTIEVRVSKKHNSAADRELLFIIRNSLKEVNENFKKIKVDELVPCNCSSDCKYQYSYNILCRALENRVNEIQCYESFRKVNVLKLLEGIEIMKREEGSPYSITIENNPNISNKIITGNQSVRANVANVHELKFSFMEIQGDFSELREELESLSEESKEPLQKQIDKINEDLEALNKMKTAEEIVRSGKLNKLRRWLSDFSDENSETRKMLSGIKNVAAIVGGIVVKFNAIADKIGINRLG
jgi:small GTP-binding protein